MPPSDVHGAPVQAYVALGANLGDTVAALRSAMQAIGDLPQTRLIRCSSLYRSAAIGAEGPDYVNAVVEIATSLDAFALLAQLQQLEQVAGRQRPYPNAPRTLDLDVLLYGDQRIATPVLTVPHPRMWERAFVLVPLNEIAPGHVPAGALQLLADQRVTLELVISCPTTDQRPAAAR